LTPIPRWLTMDRDEIEPACFGFMLSDPKLFPELMGVNIKDPWGSAQHCSHVLTTVVLTPGSGKSAAFIANADVSHSVIYQRFVHTCRTALEDLYLARPRTLEAISELRRRVDSFGKLAANWDAEGAAPISAETVNTALQVIEHIAIVLERRNTISSPSVRPFPDGSIFFKWIRGQKELAITVEGRVVEAQRWEPLDAFHSLGLWEIPVDATSEHVEWLLT
jgi:hypothetical protein